MSKKNPEEEDFKRVYQDFWVDLTYNGKELTKDQIMRELYDYYTFMTDASKVYCAVTGGRISKINTDPGVVISEALEHYREWFSEDDDE